MKAPLPPGVNVISDFLAPPVMSVTIDVIKLLSPPAFTSNAKLVVSPTEAPALHTCNSSDGTVVPIPAFVPLS